MANCITEQWGGSSTPQVELVVTETLLNNTTSNLHWVLYYVPHGYAAYVGSARSYSVVINSSVVKTGTYDINNKAGTSKLTIAEGNVTGITRPAVGSTKKINFSFSFVFEITWNGYYKGTATASSSITITPQANYTLTFNTQGGSTVSSITRAPGTTITLPSAPTKVGYDFSKWCTNSGGTGTKYDPNQSYTINSNTTLYAIWTIKMYTVTFNMNGATSSQIPSLNKVYNATETIPSTIPTKTNYIFKGWGTNTSTVTYKPGDKYSANADATLYAVWELDYAKPRITNVSVFRCNQSGTSDDNGTYGSINFKWETDIALTSSYPIKIEYKTSSESTWTSSNVSTTGKSGTVSKTLSGLLTEHTYDVRITVSDPKGYTTIARNIPGMKFVLDMRSGGTGIAFGKPAELPNTADFAFNTHFRGEINRIEHAKPYLRAKSTVTGNEILFGIDDSGVRRGIYDVANNGWMMYYNPNNKLAFAIPSTTTTTPAYLIPYVTSGDSITLTSATAGFLGGTGASTTAVYFDISLPKPIVNATTVTVTSGNSGGLRMFINGKQIQNTSSPLYIKASSYSSSITGSGIIRVTANMSTMAITTITGSQLSYTPIGIYYNLVLTFS